MEDCRESLDGESVSGDADEVTSNLDIIELETRPSSSSTLVANATTTTQQVSALPSVEFTKPKKTRKRTIPSLWTFLCGLARWRPTVMYESSTQCHPRFH